MDDQQKLLKMINSGKLHNSKLCELLHTVHKQIDGYQAVLAFVEQAGPDNWTFETYTEAVRRGDSSGQGSAITRQEWNAMLPNHQIELRRYILDTIDQEQAMFGELKTAIEQQLAQRANSSESKPTDNKKKSWQFWK